MRGSENLLGKGFGRKHDISPGKKGFTSKHFFCKEKMGQVDGS